MTKFRAGDRVVYFGTAYPSRVGKTFTVVDTRDKFIHNAIKLKEFPEAGYWNPDVFRISKPVSLENK